MPLKLSKFLSLPAPRPLLRGLAEGARFRDLPVRDIPAARFLPPAGDKTRQVMLFSPKRGGTILSNLQQTDEDLWQVSPVVTQSKGFQQVLDQIKATPTILRAGNPARDMRIAQMITGQGMQNPRRARHAYDPLARQGLGAPEIEFLKGQGMTPETLALLEEEILGLKGATQPHDTDYIADLLRITQGGEAQTPFGQMLSRIASKSGEPIDDQLWDIATYRGLVRDDPGEFKRNPYEDVNKWQLESQKQAEGIDEEEMRVVHGLSQPDRLALQLQGKWLRQSEPTKSSRPVGLFHPMRGGVAPPSYFEQLATGEVPHVQILPAELHALARLARGSDVRFAEGRGPGPDPGFRAVEGVVTDDPITFDRQLMGNEVRGAAGRARPGPDGGERAQSPGRGRDADGAWSRGTRRPAAARFAVHAGRPEAPVRAGTGESVAARGGGGESEIRPPEVLRHLRRGEPVQRRASDAGAPGALVLPA